ASQRQSTTAFMSAQMEQISSLKAQQQTTSEMMVENCQAMERMAGAIQQQDQAVQGIDKLREAAPLEQRETDFV
ncbi:unnamed protein product, partial [Prorocentrum cordatum]